MQIIREDIPKITLQEFAEKHELTMVITERNLVMHPDLSTYYCRFQNCEIKDGAALIGVSGNGKTEAEAFADYAAQISGRFLVFNAYQDSRKEIQCPILVKEKV
jgi:hypothetical protein